MTHKFNIAGHEGYVTVGTYPNGQPGEIFITMAKEGSTVSGLMDSFALAISLGLQHGVPLKLLCEKFAHTRFEPSGWSQNPSLGYAKSIMDYIFRWLELKFIMGEQGSLFDDLRPRLNGSNGVTTAPAKDAPGPRAEAAGPGIGVVKKGAANIHASDALGDFVDFGDAPPCPVCGAMMTRNGTCYRCMSCGATSGCS